LEKGQEASFSDTTEAAAEEQSSNHSRAAAWAAATATEAGQGSGSLKECSASTHTRSHPREAYPNIPPLP